MVMAYNAFWKCNEGGAEYPGVGEGDFQQGCAVVQNLFEQAAGDGNRLIRLAADGDHSSTRNCIIAHNTVVGLDGRRMYLGGLKSPFLFVADTETHTIAAKVGPFGGPVRPFTVNGAQTRCYVCVNGLLGFEVGDLTTGKLLHRVAVPGVKTGPVKRHGCPSHGVGLTPDEKEVWVVDAFNQRVHFFDNTADPPTQKESLKLREQPGWVTFSLDGKLAYPSTGEVIDTKTKKIIAVLTDEAGREVHGEKMVEIHFRGGKPVRNGDQFGVGRVRESNVRFIEAANGDSAVGGDTSESTA